MNLQEEEGVKGQVNEHLRDVSYKELKGMSAGRFDIGGYVAQKIGFCMNPS